MSGQVPAPRSFRYEEDPQTGVATLTLDRPQVLNALTFETYAELSEVLRALRERDSVRALVVTGAGRGFCSGGDVDAIIGQLFARDARGLLEFTRLTGEVVRNLRGLNKPVIASLPGVAAGAGAVIALASDLRIGSERAKFAFLFVKVGLAGADMGAAFLLPRVVGLGRATELLMLGDTIDAQTAERYGLLNRVVPEAELGAATRTLAERLARGPGFALAMTKEMLNRGLSMALDEAVEAEAQAQQICMQTRDFREAYEAFTAKREPQFQGR
ncbi:MAG TPA: enoyl-CoA hydratase family protein [Polyangia bacterium]|nr:enoyl-CoA hydratase family protein [Polyangia bacterium]